MQKQTAVLLFFFCKHTHCDKKIYLALPSNTNTAEYQVGLTTHAFNPLVYQYFLGLPIYVWETIVPKIVVVPNNYLYYLSICVWGNTVPNIVSFL